MQLVRRRSRADPRELNGRLDRVGMSRPGAQRSTGMVLRMTIYISAREEDDQDEVRDELAHQVT